MPCHLRCEANLWYRPDSGGGQAGKEWEVINDTRCELRNSPLPRHEYDCLAIFLKDAFSAAKEVPPEFIEWKVFSERHLFETAFGWDALIAAVVTPAGWGGAYPSIWAQSPPGWDCCHMPTLSGPCVTPAPLGA